MLDLVQITQTLERADTLQTILSAAAIILPPFIGWVALNHMTKKNIKAQNDLYQEQQKELTKLYANQQKAQNKLYLDQQILQMNRIGIQYPKVEEISFCELWDSDKGKNDKDYMRYGSYCCIVFNILIDMWRHFEGNKEEIEKYFNVKDMATRHAVWWKETIKKDEDSYKGEFRDFINGYLK